MDKLARNELTLKTISPSPIELDSAVTIGYVQGNQRQPDGEGAEFKSSSTHVDNDQQRVGQQDENCKQCVPSTSRVMPDWMTIRGEGSPLKKVVGEKVYSWCHYHEHWCEHTTEECRAKLRVRCGAIGTKTHRGCRGGKNRRKDRRNKPHDI